MGDSSPFDVPAMRAASDSNPHILFLSLSGSVSCTYYLVPTSRIPLPGEFLVSRPIRNIPLDSRVPVRGVEVRIVKILGVPLSAIENEAPKRRSLQSLFNSLNHPQRVELKWVAAKKPRDLSHWKTELLGKVKDGTERVIQGGAFRCEKSWGQKILWSHEQIEFGRFPVNDNQGSLSIDLYFDDTVKSKCDS